VEYLDLFSLHGLNASDNYDWIYKRGKQDSLIKAVHSLKQRGKMRHISFSTHAPVNIIWKLIESDVFEYVYLHYYWCGSYTCSGEGQYGGNLENFKLCAEKDMGVFIISAFDKGGRLYAPSKKHDP
jgi:predicted aldo/keto reductase-like oxidoreductase